MILLKIVFLILEGEVIKMAQFIIETSARHIHVTKETLEAFSSYVLGCIAILIISLIMLYL